MAELIPQNATIEVRMVPTIDLASFTTMKASASNLQRLEVAKGLVEALHSFGFTKVVGHGPTKDQIAEALEWSQKLFDLSYEDKIKAPHPPENLPYRDYLGIGKEKVYWHEDLTPGLHTCLDAGHELRKISDFKFQYLPSLMF